MHPSKSVFAEIKRRKRFLGQIRDGIQPKDKPDSYVRLGLITIAPDGSYKLTAKAHEFLRPDYFRGLIDTEPDQTQPAWPY